MYIFFALAKIYLRIGSMVPEANIQLDEMSVSKPNKINKLVKMSKITRKI